MTTPTNPEGLLPEDFQQALDLRDEYTSQKAWAYDFINHIVEALRRCAHPTPPAKCLKEDGPGDTCHFWHKEYGQEMCMVCKAQSDGAVVRATLPVEQSVGVVPTREDGSATALPEGVMSANKLMWSVHEACQGGNYLYAKNMIEKRDAQLSQAKEGE